MEWRKWLASGYGKKLRKIHAWNGWIVLMLAVTGLILYLPGLRGTIAFTRVGLKQFHIILGVVSILLLLFYLPFMRKHLKQLKKKSNQQFNLTLVLVLIGGWILSGVLLWQDRRLPKEWSQYALFWHDLLTWVGVPYVIFHSISRSRWMRKEQALQNRQAHHVTVKATSDQESINPSILEKLKKPLISRRTFIQWVTGLLFVLSLGPAFYKWLKRSLDDGGSPIKEALSENGNQMVPAPKPLANSNPPIGGGADGNFRIYSVTPIPSFNSKDWQFGLGGLVENPKQWSWDEFLKLTRKVQVSDFHCVTGWSVYKVTWEGIPLSDFLKMGGVSPQAKHAKFYSGDGVYTDTLTLKQAQLDDIMVAVLMDGEPIPQKLGGPVRLVVPKMYAYKSVKWLQAIELIDKPHTGYWEARGYDTDAWVKS